MKKPFLEIGQIVSTQGIRGEVRVQPWCDTASFLTEFDTLYFDEGKTSVSVESGWVNKNVVVLKLQGVDTVEAARTLRNRILYMDRNDVELEEGTYFIEDLIGMTVVDADSGKEYGKLTSVTQTGANDVYHITAKNGKVTMIPAVPLIVKETDVEGERMAISPIPGLFEEEEATAEDAPNAD